MRVWLSIRRIARNRLTVAVLALAVTALAMVPVGTSGGPCGTSASDVRPAAAVGFGGAEDVPRPRTGIDLEVRILNLRVQFPWMRSLPVSPGHRIVISLLGASTADPRS
jgi:hypothetical protein